MLLRHPGPDVLCVRHSVGFCIQGYRAYMEHGPPGTRLVMSWPSRRAGLGYGTTPVPFPTAMLLTVCPSAMSMAACIPGLNHAAEDFCTVQCEHSYQSYIQYPAFCPLHPRYQAIWLSSPNQRYVLL